MTTDSDRAGRAVQVRLRTTASTLDAHRSDGQPFSFLVPDDVTVAIEDEPKPEKGSRNLKVVTAMSSIVVTEDERTALQAHVFEFGAIPQADWTDEQWGRHIDPPGEVRSALAPAEQRLSRAAETVVTVMRWRFYSPGAPVPHGRFEFSLDGMPWVQPWTRLGHFPWPQIESEAGSTTVQALQEALNDGAQAPLAWELYYEALRLSRNTPRAAFVVAFTAAEVGVKEFGGRRSDSEKWLLEVIQAPAMNQLLSNYVPLFVSVRLRTTTSNNKEQCVPDWIRAVLREAMEKRNKVVHSPLGFEPDYNPSVSDVRQLLAAVADLLYLLDWFGGQTWAFDYVSEKSRACYPEGAEPGAPLSLASSTSATTGDAAR